MLFMDLYFSYLQDVERLKQKMIHSDEQSKIIHYFPKARKNDEKILTLENWMQDRWMTLP